MIIAIFIIHFAPLCMTESGSGRGARELPATAERDFVTSHKLALEQGTALSGLPRCWYRHVMWTAAYFVSFCVVGTGALWVDSGSGQSFRKRLPRLRGDSCRSFPRALARAMT